MCHNYTFVGFCMKLYIKEAASNSPADTFSASSPHPVSVIHQSFFGNIPRDHLGGSLWLHMPRFSDWWMTHRTVLPVGRLQLPLLSPSTVLLMFSTAVPPPGHTLSSSSVLSIISFTTRSSLLTLKKKSSPLSPLPSG